MKRRDSQLDGEKEENLMKIKDDLIYVVALRYFKSFAAPEGSEACARKGFIRLVAEQQWFIVGDE